MYRLFAILTMVLVEACIDRVDLPIRAETPRLVVEGQITNEAPPYTIRLTYTGNYSSGQNPSDQYVKEAQIRLADDRGRSTGFRALGQGLYQSIDNTFRGQIGRTYSLSVVLSDGKRYASKPEQMPDVPAIDSVYVAGLIRDERSLYRYFLQFNILTTDPAGSHNYYRWLAKSYSVLACSDYLWVPFQNSAVNLLSDEAIDGNAFRRFVIKAPVFSAYPYLVEVRQYGITPASYQFWGLYQQQNSRTGSIFDPLPAPIVGNLINQADPTDKARGFFEVCSVTTKRVRFYDIEEIWRPGVQSYITSISQSGFFCNYPPPGLFPLRVNPPGF
ncbi:DUF4249 domain-containing protein [Spirosoma gilvum]